MGRLLFVALVTGAAVAVAYLPGAIRRGRGPASPQGAAAPSPTVAPAAAATPGGPATLAVMLEVGHRARLKRFEPAPAPAERQRAIEDAIDHGAVDARRAALRALALSDRSAAAAIARARLADPVLFAEAARALLVQADGVPDGADLARVKKELRTGGHDEASAVAVSVLVLETLIRLESPAAPAFVAALERDPSPRVRAVAARFGGGRQTR